MNLNSINYSYSANIQTRPKKRPIVSAKFLSFGSLSQIETGAKIKEFKEKGDFFHWAKFLNNKDEFPHQEFNEIRGKYITDYFVSLQKQAKEKLGSTIAVKIPQGTDKSAFFAYKDPEAFFQIYETIAKYKTLGESVSKIPKKGIAGFFSKLFKKFATVPKPVYPRLILITQFQDKTAGNCNEFGIIRLNDLIFINNNTYQKSNKVFEHEIWHLKDIIKNGFNQSFTYLDILGNREKMLYKKYNKNTNLEDLNFYLQEIKRLNLQLSSKQRKNFFKQYFLKEVKKTTMKLAKFSYDIQKQISLQPHHRSDPRETKAEAGTIRAKGIPVSPDYLLPITEELEKQLTKLGMPEPETYTILAKDHPVRKVAGFGEELVKRLSPELLQKLKR